MYDTVCFHCFLCINSHAMINWFRVSPELRVNWQRFIFNVPYHFAERGKMRLLLLFFLPYKIKYSVKYLKCLCLFSFRSFLVLLGLDHINSVFENDNSIQFIIGYKS